ncbi:hypothetical protein DM02DRAFT_388285 [Periconia macrospinosa]|uniref:Zn(2)-C6 fungal-type domain-containing protein n=1 Tax=Periconia macrospinosa TaxID=97972 RepID=A0A2V1DQV0_9PLEO|nr:hypothetical protein DM02DRAFT_388285 [Periconia macrospinosa]
MLRRNGKPRSCEPCRIAKTRCDHATPVCDRCRTRGITEQCFYHPNPMTRPPGVPRKKPEPRRRTMEKRISKAPHYEAITPPDTDSSPSVIRIELPLPKPTCPVNMWPSPSEIASKATQGTNEETCRRAFFLGSTSYASVFVEERPLPESIHEQPPERITATPSLPADQSNTGSRHCRMSIGTTILSKLSHFSFFKRAVERYFWESTGASCIGPLVTSALPQLSRDLERLDSYTACAEITRNTVNPLKVPSNMVASEFYTLFTGPNLRWEILGLVMVLAASGAQYTSPDDPIFDLEGGGRINKDAFVEDMIHASNDCINLCKVHGAVNDIIVWLLYHNMLVKSNFYGDNYHGVWRGMSETISTLYAGGMHCEESFDEPFFFCEARRRMYAAVFRSDKTLANFFGRPPLMNWRYSDRPLPLDIDENVIMCTDTELLNTALSKLDNEGWNTEGKINSVSWVRLRAKMSISRERFLELSLSGRRIANLEEEIQNVQIQHRQAWEGLPKHLRCDLYDEETIWDELGSMKALKMVNCYLEFLHMEFQIQRLLRRQTQTALPGLLEICMKLLLSTISILNRRGNREYFVQRHFATIVLFYCLPSAGVLALELRRCTLENVQLPDTVSRADIIRNLSVLISCMDWSVFPEDGNHKLCRELNKMLSLVLDEVLNYQPPINGAQSDNNDSALQGLGPGFFDLPTVDGIEPIPTESEDFLNWLTDNANWNNTSLF